MLFDSEDNAAAAERTFDEEMPSRLGDLFKSWEGCCVSVDRYKADRRHPRLARPGRKAELCGVFCSDRRARD